MITRYDPNLAVQKAAHISEDLQGFLKNQFNFRGYIHKAYLSYLLDQYMDHIKKDLEQSGEEGNEKRMDYNLDSFMWFRKLVNEVQEIKNEKIYLHARMAS
ncbi:MAG: hypothetical protein GVY19_05570 [Bacteroidetes bacterium]|nr:hypothetical protein [Bacteroidota bacterium]